MVTPKQGDVFWIESETKRRPALVVTRTQAIPVLNRVLVAPVTRSIRGIPTEIRLDRDQGLREPAAAAFDNMELIAKSFLTEKVGTLVSAEAEICLALEALADC